MDNIQFTKNFSLNEFIRSTTARKYGIDNTPSPEVIANLRALCENVLQPLRDAYGGVIRISSGYRCPKLNRAVKGARTSQHQYGMAADLKCADNRKLFQIARELGVFDQLINEYNLRWVHISFNPKGVNRKQVLRIR